MMINEEKLDKVLLELGFSDYHFGTAYLRHAVKIWMPGTHVYKAIYPAVAKMYRTTPARAERCMRHSIERAMLRADYDTIRKYFGNSIDPQRGKPTNGEYVARLWSICHEN